MLSGKSISDGIWSFFGTTASVLTGLAVVKIITSQVSADNYGNAALALGMVALLNGLLCGPLMTAHLRIYFDYMERGMGRWFAEVFRGILGVAGLAAVGVYLLVAILYALSGKSIYLRMLIPVAVVVVAQPYLSALTSYLEAHRSYRRLAVVNILQKVFHPLILLLLLFLALPQVPAIIVSQGLAALVILLIFRPPVEQKASGRIPEAQGTERAAIRSSIVNFGWALPAGYLIMWVMTTSDRFLIDYFRGPESVGVYAINYGFWSIPYLMLNGWLEIWTRPVIYDKSAKNDWEGVRRIICLRALFGLSASIIGTVILYFAGEPISSVMLGRRYWAGTELMLIIAVAHCFFVIGYSVMPVFLASKKPKAILYATGLGALINLVVNVLLIPSHGIQGAAISTLVSYVIWAIVLSILSYEYLQESIHIQFNARGKEAEAS